MKIKMLLLVGLSLFTAPTVFAQYAEDKNVYEDEGGDIQSDPNAMLIDQRKKSLAEGGGIQSDPNAMSRILLLLDGGVLKNQEFIRREAENISPEDRQILYKSREKGGTAGYVALNTVIGFGVGSFIQGDVSSGVTLLLVDVGAISVLATAQNSTMLYLGLGAYVLSVIDGIIMPIVYTHKYNRILKGALRLDEPASISMRPLILDNGAVGMSVALNY